MRLCMLCLFQAPSLLAPRSICRVLALLGQPRQAAHPDVLLRRHLSSLLRLLRLLLGLPLITRTPWRAGLHLGKQAVQLSAQANQRRLHSV